MTQYGFEGLSIMQQGSLQVVGLLLDLLGCSSISLASYFSRTSGL